MTTEETTRAKGINALMTRQQRNVEAIIRLIGKLRGGYSVEETGSAVVVSDLMNGDQWMVHEDGRVTT